MKKHLGAAMNASCTFATLNSKRVIAFRFRTRHVDGPTSNHRSIMHQQAAHTRLSWYIHIFSFDDPAQSLPIRTTITIEEMYAVV